MKNSIMVAVLTGHEHTQWVHPELLGTCFQMAMWHSRTGASFHVTTVHGVSPVDAARNIAVKQMLMSDAEWLLQIDNDIVPPHNLLASLTDIGNRKIVGFPYGIHYAANGPCFLIGDCREGNKVELATSLPVGWSKVDMVGSGCLLVHRDVFAALSEPWFQCGGPKHTGEDFYFCEKARRSGLAIWTHSDFVCRHYRTVDISALVPGVPRK